MTATRLSNDAVTRLREVATLPALPDERYVVTKVIGRGGMGVVYAARDNVLERDVAIKVSNTASARTALDARLRQEARVLAALEHPGIVPVHDAGELADGRLFYVMKRVQGATLADLRSTLTTEAGVLAIFERVVDAVAFAHDAGVVHCDLKPSNVMVGRFGEVLVLDWGVAAVMGEAGAPDVVAGTPAFMPPEQKGRAAALAPTVDVYALGAMLFWLLTGMPPPAAIDAQRRMLRGASSPPGRRLRAIILKSLAPLPDARYASASVLAADLARYRSGAPVEAHRERAIERAGRWLYRYRTFLLMVAAYLLMRAAFAFWSARP